MEFTRYLVFAMLIPGIIALVRFRSTEYQLLPMLGLFIYGSITEIAAFWSRELYGTGVIVYNIYTLLEPLFLFYSFYLWQTITKRKFIILSILSTAFWILETLNFSLTKTLSSFHLMGYGLIVIILAIHEINRFLLSNENNPLRNPKFIFCSTLIMMFTYMTMIELLWKYGGTLSQNFQLKSDLIFKFTNFFANLIFAYGVLCIPRKQRFLMS